ncbi:MAG: zinc ribbon domain-containing protein [Mycobacterium sp.]|nr:zinc ribbon domain-containing protein [Mycobacterium sp.]
MSTEAESDAVPTMECRVCQTEVPAGAFCGLCGGHLTPEPGDGPQWLRPGTFGPAPDESLLRPSIASSLFPQLPQRSRTPFRVGLALIVLGLAVFAVLKVPAALITVAALGLPLLFLLYLAESDAYRDLPARVLAVAAVFGAALGVGYVLLTGEMVARSYGVPMAAGLAMHHVMREGVAIPTGGMLLMLVPVALARLLPYKPREVLDGFVVGALGALMFAAGATLTRLAPQFATGLFAHSRPIKGLIVEAAICGVTIPLTAAAAGGAFGMALWFRGQTGNPHERPGRVRALLFGFAAVILVAHLAVGVVDVVGLPQLVMLTIHAVMTLLALLLLRVAVQIALLHEAHDPVSFTDPLLCVHCEHVVPDMAFCPACGAASRASSRTSRADRRRSRPVRTVAAEGQ